MEPASLSPEEGLSWLIVNVFPLMVSVPERAAPVLAATVKLTVPLPVPEAGPTMVIQLAVVETVQLPAPVEVTPTVPPPSDGAKNSPLSLITTEAFCSMPSIAFTRLLASTDPRPVT